MAGRAASLDHHLDRLRTRRRTFHHPNHLPDLHRRGRSYLSLAFEENSGRNLCHRPLPALVSETLQD